MTANLDHSFSPGGFVDLQVNGFGGINFSSDTLSLAEVENVAGALSTRGTLAFCPTVITSAREVYRHALPALAKAIHSEELRRCLPGIHLEGPFLSPEDGARGVHPRAHIVAPDQAFLQEMWNLAEGTIRILTVAPEIPGALDLIEFAVNLGIVVAIGHTMADAAAIQAAVRAGASLSTHLGNGCPNYLHRHHNPIWPQLASPALTAMLITDGHHLPAEMIGAFLAAKTSRRVIVTSDASPAAGCPPGEYSFFGSRVLLEPGGRLRSLEQDTLAGSSATMLECMNYLASLDLLSEEELWRVGCDYPLEVLGKTRADLPVDHTVRFDGKQFRITD